MEEIEIYKVIFLGMSSFLNPWSLLIIPGFIAYLFLIYFHDIGFKKREMFLNSLFFVLGFSFILSVLGSIIHISYPDILIWFSILGGLFMFVFGIYLAVVFYKERIILLEKEKELHIKRRFGIRYTFSFIFGLALAFSLSFYTGDIIKNITDIKDILPGGMFILLFYYSLGFSFSFLIFSFLITELSSFIGKYPKIIIKINIIFSIILAIFGLLIINADLGRHLF